MVWHSCATLLGQVSDELSGDTWMNDTSKKANKRGLYFQTICAASLLTILSGSTTTDTVTQSYKGVINLDGVRLGLPEESAKGAILTFVADPSVYGGVTQYLSRIYDKDNGQYCLGYVNGDPHVVRVVYSQAPVSKETALARLKMILPTNAPEETKVDDSQVKAGKKESPVEYHFYGDKLKAEVIFTDKSAKLVKVLGVMNLKSDQKDSAGKAKTAEGNKPSSDKQAE